MGISGMLRTALCTSLPPLLWPKLSEDSIEVKVFGSVTNPARVSHENNAAMKLKCTLTKLALTDILVYAVIGRLGVFSEALARVMPAIIYRFVRTSTV